MVRQLEAARPVEQVVEETPVVFSAVSEAHHALGLHPILVVALKELACKILDCREPMQSIVFPAPLNLIPVHNHSFPV